MRCAHKAGQVSGRLAAGLVVLAVAVLAGGARGGTDTWRMARPSNSGIPGEEIRFVRFDGSGMLWVGARWPFWEEGGVGIYSRDDQTWTTWANFETPIPSEYVNDIEFGPGGVIWIATAGGLVRKEGETWTVYTAANSPLLHDEVRNIALDSQGDVWINNSSVRHNTAALFEFDGTVWRMFTVPNDLPWEDPWRALSTVHVDRADHVWVANMTLPGVVEYDGSTWVMHGEDVAQFKFITSDPPGNIWLIEGSLAYNFYRFDGTTFTAYGAYNTPLSQTTITTMGQDAEGTLYVGNWGGEVIRSGDGGETWEMFTVLPSRVTGIAPDALSSDVWIGTAGSVHRVDGAGVPRQTVNTYNSGVPWFWIDNFYLDQEGSFWMATDEAGASRFDGLRWRNWGQHNGGSEPWGFLAEQAFALYQDTQGYMWIGSNGVGRLDLETGQLRIWDWQNTPEFGVTLFTYIAEDRNGTIFAMEEAGKIYRFHADTETWSQEPVNVSGYFRVPRMHADGQGNLWATNWWTLVRWNGQVWEDLTSAWGLDQYTYLALLAVGPDDSLWIGSEQGLLRVQEGQITVFDTTNSPLWTNSIVDVTFRSDGLMALTAHEFNAQTSGVAVVAGDPADPANWTVYRYPDAPLPHWQLGVVGFDAAGDLWIAAESMGAAILETGPAGVPGDFDGDGDVDIADFAFFAACFGGSGIPCAGECCAADLDGDGDVDIADFSTLAANFTGSG